MIPKSSAIAVVAIVLSLLAHFFGLSLTTADQLQPAANEVPANEVTSGITFEDVAEEVLKPVEPEAAETPVPEAEPQDVPEPEQAEQPTSEALVASSNPQATTSPSIGSGQAVRPETTGPAEQQLGDVPEPTTIEPSNGSEEAVAKALAAPPDGTDTVTELPEGEPAEQPEPLQSVPVTPTVSPAPQQLAVLTPVSPVTPLVSETVEPESLTPPIEPENTDTSVSEDESTPSETTVTASLRPRLPTTKPPSKPAGFSSGSTEVSRTRRAPAPTIRSPLAAYQSDGINPFAGQSGGSRSGGSGSLNSGGVGNSSVTNYAGRVLSHLNNVPVSAASGQGQARVFFEINPDGSLASVSVIDRVGSPSIERAAKEQVRNGAPFPRPPDGKRKKLSFVFNVR